MKLKTMRVNETLCFLDTQIKRVDKKLSLNIYRTTTATSRYIPIESHHRIQHKSAAFKSMIHRLVTTPLSPDDATTELNEIKTIAKINGYSEEFVDRIHNKHKKKEELRNLTTQDFPEPSNRSGVFQEGQTQRQPRQP
jgi:hypothetical protein